MYVLFITNKSNTASNEMKKKIGTYSLRYTLLLLFVFFVVVCCSFFGADFKWNLCNYRRTCSPVETTLKCAHFCHCAAINSLE